MTHRLLLAALALVILPAAWADEADDNKFFALGPECLQKNGELEVHFYSDSKIWLNGIRQSTHEDDPYLQLKPGDVVVTGSPIKWHEVGKPSLPVGDFYRYRLDSIAGGKAYFTLTSFDDEITPLSPKVWHHSMGVQPLSMVRFEVSLPDIIFGLDGFTKYLEGRSDHISRSK